MVSGFAFDYGNTHFDPQNGFMTFICLQAGLTFWHLVRCAIEESPNGERMGGALKLWGAAILGFCFAGGLCFSNYSGWLT